MPISQEEFLKRMGVAAFSTIPRKEFLAKDKKYNKQFTGQGPRTELSEKWIYITCPICQRYFKVKATVKGLLYPRPGEEPLRNFFRYRCKGCTNSFQLTLFVEPQKTNPGAFGSPKVEWSVPLPVSALVDLQYLVERKKKDTYTKP